MQKAYVYAVLAPILYALANVILEHKFSKFNNLTLMIAYTSMVLTLAIVMRAYTKTEDVSYQFPVSADIWLVLVAMSLVYFAADYFFIGAYTNGGDLFTITILTVLFPVFASIFKFTGSLVFKEMVYAPPNLMQMSGYALGATAVILVVKGAPSP